MVEDILDTSLDHDLLFDLEICRAMPRNKMNEIKSEAQHGFKNIWSPFQKETPEGGLL